MTFEDALAYYQTEAADEYTSHTQASVADNDESVVLSLMNEQTDQYSDTYSEKNDDISISSLFTGTVELPEDI
jgi:hypothetical protein